MGGNMTEIRYVKKEDEQFWFSLDSHLSKAVFEEKVRTGSGYVLLLDGNPIGLLRYSLFWDNTPFCNMLFVDGEYQRKGYGRQLMEFWENEMKKQGYAMLLTSTQADETAQHFYRKLGYKDCGSLIIDIPRFAQPMEIFFIKEV